MLKFLLDSLQELLTSLGFVIKREIDIGHLLTVFTLAVGFLGWTYSTVRGWQKSAREDAGSGALRLILRILRERKGVPIKIAELMNLFHSPAMKLQRKAYCGQEYRFKNPTRFEAAIYRLDYEGKTRFVSEDEVVFRADWDYLDAHRFPVSDSDSLKITKILETSLADEQVTDWELERLAIASMRVSTKSSIEIIRSGLHGQNASIAKRAAMLLAKLVPER